MREVVFIGSDYYKESKSIMSCIYEKIGSEYKRFDWGFFEIALRNGDCILTRQATKEESDYFKSQLDEVRKRLFRVNGLERGGR